MKNPGKIFPWRGSSRRFSWSPVPLLPAPSCLPGNRGADCKCSTTEESVSSVGQNSGGSLRINSNVFLKGQNELSVYSALCILKAEPPKIRPCAADSFLKIPLYPPVWVSARRNKALAWCWFNVWETTKSINVSEQSNRVRYEFLVLHVPAPPNWVSHFQGLRVPVLEQASLSGQTLHYSIY